MTFGGPKIMLRRSNLHLSVLLIVAISIANFSATRAHASEGHAPHEARRGSHGGRLLSHDLFEIEITIFERGVPPEYRVYAYAEGKPIDPSEVNLKIELRRLAGRTDYFQFAPFNDYLRGDKVVEEPHSFDVFVTAVWQGQSYTWSYDSYEGRTEITPEAAKDASITIGVVGPAEISSELSLTGRIIQDSEQTLRIGARYPGLVKFVYKRLGDNVKRGEVLAVVEANASMNRFEVKSPIDGTITMKNVNSGETVHDQNVLFELSNLSHLLVEFHASRDDMVQIKLGQPVSIDLDHGLEPVITSVSYIAPISSTIAQSVAVRAMLPNPNRSVIPGLFVRGKIQTEKKLVALAVKKEAIQTFRDWHVVFLQDGNLYEIRPLELGREDTEWVEVRSGIEAGQKYVMSGSFVVKADIGKNAASHDH